MGLIRKYFLALLIFLILSACYSRVETFGFKVSNGTISLFKRVSDKAVTYKLEDEISIEENKAPVFVFGYRSLSPFVFSVLSSKREVLISKRLTLVGKTGINISLPLSPGDKIWGFKINSPSVNVDEVGISEENKGRLFDFENGKLDLSNCVEVLNPSTVNEDFFTSFRIRVNGCENDEGEKNSPGSFLVLKINNLSRDLAPFLVTLKSKAVKDRLEKETGNWAKFSFKLPHREEKLFLYPSVFRFNIGRKKSWEIVGEGNAQIKVYSLDLNCWRYNKLYAIPADPGTVLNYNPLFWRHREFEIFSWNLFPKMLIMDTANYHVQSEFFKRLAFFIEKKGYVGKIVKEELLKNKHGYNAHDYRAEDLARFYNTAYKEKVILNPYERLLKKILLYNGVLKGNIDGCVYPITGGGIISFSRSSGPYLRRLLLTHESYHGVFFSVPSYREACFSFWETLSPIDREFWKLFLSWKGYNIEKDRYLLVNEFQAYMFQQKEKDVTGYFRRHIIPMMFNSYMRSDNAKKLTELKKLVDFIGKKPDYFKKLYLRLECELFKFTGMRGGSVFILKKVQLNQ